MSFAFDWAAFSENDVFLEKCKRLLNLALNKKLPSVIEGPITVSELSWGDQAPTLETLEIGEVASDKFRGIFKLNYKGNGRITLATKVQANLLNVYGQQAPEWTLPKTLGSNGSLSIPLNLTLSDIKMSGIVICVFSRAKGLTCVFRNDPLQYIKVSSTFDGIPGIASFLQSQIENLIGGLFREELPAILYAHSQMWTRAAQEEVAAVRPTQNQHREDFFEQHMEIQQEFENYDAPTPSSVDERVSFINTLRLEALAVTRRTLALSTPQVATTILRSELSRRYAVAAAAVPVTVDGSQIHEHVHSQAQRLATKNNHRPKRRVINLKKRKEEPVQEQRSVSPLPRRVGRTNSSPNLGSSTNIAGLVAVQVPQPSVSKPAAPQGAQLVPPKAPVHPATVPSKPSLGAGSVVDVKCERESTPTPIRVPPTVPAVPLLTRQTKDEVERITSLLYPATPATSFFLANTKLREDSMKKVSVPLEAPPAYAA